MCIFYVQVYKMYISDSNELNLKLQIYISYRDYWSNWRKNAANIVNEKQILKQRQNENHNFDYKIHVLYPA